jgi:hypothetical protein
VGKPLALTSKYDALSGGGAAAGTEMCVTIIASSCASGMLFTFPDDDMRNKHKMRPMHPGRHNKVCDKFAPKA